MALQWSHPNSKDEPSQSPFCCPILILINSKCDQTLFLVALPTEEWEWNLLPYIDRNINHPN